jgi:tetratricopeptide (TPR) repeat protein
MRKHVHHLIAIAAICLWASASYAQDAKIRRAEEAFKLLRYKEAIQLYEEVLAKKEDLQVRLSLALAYRKLQDYDRAAATFSKIKDWSNISPDYMLQYGCVLVRSSDCEDAQQWFNAYLARNPHDSRAPMFRNACAAMQQLMVCNEGLYEVFPMPFNTEQSEMAPMIYGNQLVFASDRNAEQGPFLDLFSADRFDSTAQAQVPPARGYGFFQQQRQSGFFHPQPRRQQKPHRQPHCAA